ncbi:DMT family transporter [Roseicyclus sp.]|uniref:DMT family transporter n=1 Tax=Roseicyclus sp. TaxID=1914329 RepID=UPI001BCDEBE5|nr:DMT family transporter [Roseicyclus sp.]
MAVAPLVFVLLWAGGYAFAKLGLAHAEPMTLLALRYGLAFVALAPFLFRRGIVWPQERRHWGALALTGILIQCVYFGLAYLAMKRGMNAGTTALIMALQPLLVAVAGPFLGKVAVTPRVWGGLALGFAGVAVVIVTGGTLGPSPAIAVALALAALAGMTAATLFEGWHGLRCDPAVGGAVQYAVGFALLMPVAFVTEGLAFDWHPELTMSLAYLVIGNSIIAIGLYIAMLQRGDATRISALLYLVPPLALAIAWLVLGERPGPLSLFGFALSMTGVYIVHRKLDGGGRTA